MVLMRQDDNSSSSYVALLIVCVLTVLWYVKSSKQRAKLPPGPWSLPLLGSLHLLGNLPQVSLKSLSDRYGELMYLKLGSVPFVVFSSASMAKEIFGVHSIEFASKRATIAGKCLGNDFSGIVYSMHTPQYIRLKKVLTTHLLSPVRLRLYEKARQQEQLVLLRSLHENSNKPTVVREKLHTFNLNTITFMLFGERYAVSSMAEAVKFEDFVSLIIQALRMSGYFNISDYVPAIRWLDVQGIERKLKQIMSLINKHLLHIINEHRARRSEGRTSEDPQCFVDALLSIEGSEKLSEVSMVTLIFDALLGAVDTSALSAEWALTELIRHPSILKKAQEELEQAVGSERLVQESDLPKLPYIEAIAKETSRLHPLVPILLNREVTSSCTIKGYRIPAGVGAIINIGAILLDEKLWDKPLEFHPERFLDSDIDILGMSYKLIPFGVGRRMCPGAKLGYDTLRLAVATMVQGFDWNEPLGASHIDMSESYGLVCHKTQPLVAVPRPRLPLHVY